MAEPANGKVVVRKGTTVSLECRANGNPAPTVAWFKRGRRIEDKGALSNNGMVMTIRDVTRKNAGLYTCQASNGVGNPATEELRLQVLCE